MNVPWFTREMADAIRRCASVGLVRDGVIQTTIYLHDADLAREAADCIEALFPPEEEEELRQLDLDVRRMVP